MIEINAEIWSLSQLKDDMVINDYLHDLIISHIETGKLQSGEKLPAYRVLAKHYSVHDTSVQRIYGRLVDKGWLEAKLGSGTYVSFNFPNSNHFYPETQAVKWLPIPLGQPPFIKEEEGFYKQDFVTIGFDVPDSQYVLQGLEFSKTKKNYNVYKKNTQLARIKATQGAAYKAAIFEYLNSKRSFLINRSGLEVVLGRKESLQQVFNVLLKPDDVIVNTSPKDEELCNILKNYKEVKSHEIPMDHNFLIELKILLSHTKIKVIHLRPQCSFPESYVLESNICAELLSLAIAHSFYIFEEDDYHEFWREKMPFTPLVCYEHKGHVIYSGALSLISPYTQQTRTIVASEEFIKLFQKQSLPISPYKDIILEQMITDMLNNNKLWHMIKRMQNEINNNCFDSYMLMVNALSKVLILNKPTSGLSIWLEFPDDEVLSSSIEYLERNGFQVPYLPGSQKAGPGVKNVRLGFASWKREFAEEYSKALIAKYSSLS